MSRQLLVMRHAKSAWPTGVPDHHRPLARRGERDAVATGRLLAVRDLLPDHVVASPAQRTQETARRVLAAAGSTTAVTTEAELYDGDAFQVLRELPERASRVLLVGHEPEVVELLRTLCGADARVPTAALALLELEAPWPLQPAGRGVLQWLVTPKLLSEANWATVSGGT